MRPVTPELLPVASEEHELPSTERSTRVPKFVHPSSCSQDGGWAVLMLGCSLPSGWRIVSGPRTALTTIVCGNAPGWLWCSAASSAAEAITATPWL